MLMMDKHLNQNTDRTNQNKNNLPPHTSQQQQQQQIHQQLQQPRLSSNNNIKNSSSIAFVPLTLSSSSDSVIPEPIHYSSTSQSQQSYQQQQQQQHHHHHLNQHQHQQQQSTSLVTTTAAEAIITVVAPSSSSSSSSSTSISSSSSSSSIAVVDATLPSILPPSSSSSSSTPILSTSLSSSSLTQQQHPQSTEMISTQPVVTLVSTVNVSVEQQSQSQYITVSSSDQQQQDQHNVTPQQPPTPQQQQQQQQPSQSQTNQLESDVTDNNAAVVAVAEQHTPHTSYEDYNYPNGANSAGPMATYYVTDSYTHSAYYTTSLPDGYVVMDPTVASTATAATANDHPMNQTHHQPTPVQPTQLQQQPSQTISNNGLISHRDTIQILTDEVDYNKSYQQPARISVQPQTVNWLLENYETADGVSLPRSTLYSHYQQHCQVNNMEPVNAASFGKLIRSVFVGLRTRRLGTRGNSKYHYYGIRVKANSPLNDNNNGSVENNTMPPVKRSKLNHISSNNNSNNTTNNNNNVINNNNPKANNNNNNSNNNINNNNNNVNAINDLQHMATTKESLQSYLGDSRQLLDTVWPQQDNQQQQQQQQQDESQKRSNMFYKSYRIHFDKIINALSELSFQEVENIWLSFWQPPNTSIDNDVEHQLSLQSLRELTKTDMSNWIAQTDYTMYNSILTTLLLPNLLKPIPQILTQQIRNFAKCINKWMLNALQGYSDEFIRMKTAAVSSLSHMLRRYTSLNHLSTAACAVLKNQQQVSQMINDLNKVDFKNVQEQASWVCQCDEEIVHQIESSFKGFLSDQCPYDRWAYWCEEVLNMSLSNHNISTAKQFFFKWEFYSSLVMRDLTLRSAQSFGSFHLIRLLFDEYIFYLVEQRIAKATQTTPLKMLGELASNSRNISTTTSSGISTTRINNTNLCKQTTQYNDNMVGQQQQQQQPPQSQQPQQQQQPVIPQ
ncbi:Transcription factor rfx3 [Dermatophagoides pteronyssinus]|uniref:Transcription factor rfx3 n=1 Tax=Dermatophagoides pteronyssinus TaxID=6956 RepID=A0ABQ8JAY4_DERPT|nr:Transcription factor rfx3 [Dermatophagoides pteronyssinus]